MIAENENRVPVAFMGVDGQKLEMLFLAPEERCKGIGKQLIRYGVEHYAVNEVSVSRQNPEAIGFCERMGFRTFKRGELDEQGNSYPLLYMRHEEKF